MGVIKAGRYKYGYKTEVTLETFNPGTQVVGDTVFDTTRGKRRIWDGYNWATPNGKSIQYSTTESVNTGDAIQADDVGNLNVRRTQGTAALESLVGFIAVGGSITAGDYKLIEYVGDVWAATNAGSGPSTVTTGDLTEVTTTVGRMTEGSGIGLACISLANDITTATIIRCYFFGSAERN